MRESEVRMFVEHYGYSMNDFLDWMMGQTVGMVYAPTLIEGEMVMVGELDYYPQDVLKFITEGGKKAKVSD